MRKIISKLNISANLKPETIDILGVKQGVHSVARWQNQFRPKNLMQVHFYYSLMYCNIRNHHMSYKLYMLAHSHCFGVLLVIHIILLL
jgi:hypothetical protein